MSPPEPANSLGTPLEPLKSNNFLTTTQGQLDVGDPDLQNLLTESQTVNGERLKNGGSTERPKVVLRRARWKALYLFLLVHFIPLGVSLALIVINARTYFYGTDASMLNLLQFVSKIHEVLIQGSIATIMVTYLQYLVTNESPIPFGAIFTTFRVTQLSVLWSGELWATVTTKTFSRHLYLSFILLVPFSILLASTVGPSSAIAMLPRQTIYRLPDWELGSNLTYDSNFPGSLSNASPPLSNTSATRNELSLAAGWEYLRGLPAVSSDKQIETGLQPESINLGDNTGRIVWVMPQLYSIAIPTVTPWWELLPGPTQIVRTLYVQYAPNGTFATVQHIPVALSLSTAARHFTTWFSNQPVTINASTEYPQPYVSTFCQLNTILNENDTRPIQFPTAYVAGCGERCQTSTKNWAKLVNYTGVTRQELWKEAKRTSQGRMIWVDDIPSGDSAGQNEFGVVVVQPELCNAGKLYLTTSACTVGARWGNTTAQLQITSDGLNSVSANIASKLSTTSLETIPQWSESPIHISLEWANSLNQPTSVQNRTLADNLLRDLPITDNLCPWNATYGLDAQGFPRSRAYMHEALVSSLLANGISHSAGASEQWWKRMIGGEEVWEHDVFPSGDLEQKKSPPAMVLGFQGSLKGYAWTMEGVPIKLAITVLCLYCLYALVYVVYTFWTGHSSMAWSSIAELVTLALNSMPTSSMKNTSGGIDKRGTFKELVTVREVERNHRLEMVFPQDGQDRGPTRRVAWNVAY